MDNHFTLNKKKHIHSLTTPISFFTNYIQHPSGYNNWKFCLRTSKRKDTTFPFKDIFLAMATKLEHRFSFLSYASVIRGIFVVVRWQLPFFLRCLRLCLRPGFLQQFHNPSHGRAIDWERASAEKANVEELADFFLVTRIKLGVNHMVHAFLVQGGADPLHQILLAKLRVNRQSPCHQLKNNHAKTVDVTLLVHSKRVRIFCKKFKQKYYFT